MRIPILAAIATALAACQPGADDGTRRDVPREDAGADDGVDRCDGGCADGQTCCSGYCTDTDEDDLNCGECENVCDTTELCERGFCYAAECVPECGENMLCCWGDCVDFLNDEQNCGDCGEECPAGVECQSGMCLCGGRICPIDQECCDGACIDIWNDNNNCGRCGNSCDGLPCHEGSCVCGDTECPTGWTCCDAEVEPVCYDLMNDSNHCGSCISRCNPKTSNGCVEGVCVCGDEPQCTSSEVYPACHVDPWLPVRRCCRGTCKTVDDSSCSTCDTGCSGGDECLGRAGLGGCEYYCGTP